MAQAYHIELCILCYITKIFKNITQLKKASKFVQLLLEDHNSVPDHGLNLFGVWQNQNKKNIYRVIHKSVKHLKNSQQIDYVTGHGNSYADRERNSKFFFKEKPVHIIALVCR
jgi:hypothetical protein